LSRFIGLARAKVRGHAFLLAACTALTLSIAVASAEAATYNYCSGCTISSSSLVKASTYRYITLDYVHRLSGPGSGVTIGAIAQYADNGSWGNYVYSTSTEVTHGYSGSRPAWAAAANFGAGNYGFNAHANY
jgi:hypothetical protein